MRKKIAKIRVNKLFSNFFESEKSGGLILVIATIVSLCLANSIIEKPYNNFWSQEIFGEHLSHWVNDGLMTVFFLLIGLELKREVQSGELSNIKNSTLPLFAAFGGMTVPAALFILLNFQLPTQSGAGIPMATDIAFAIGILSLLGKRIPISLKIFLTALAVIDDLGAIIIIAIFYTNTIYWVQLLIALSIWVLLLILNKLNVRNLIIYVIGGAAMWYFMLYSGVHATLAGVLVALVIPAKSKNGKSASYILQDFLHKPVAFLILPLFAMANTNITIPQNWVNGLMSYSSLGIIVGLFIGKPLGIFLFSYLGVKSKFCELPKNLTWKNIIGVGFLGGIGFTMSIFITLLAYDNIQIIDNTKIAILLASTIAGFVGFILLKLTLRLRIND